MTVASAEVGAMTSGPDYPLIDAEWGEDPLEGIPQPVLNRLGVMDHDTAGGCG
ncbi:hypothetical protein ACWD4N_00340 [Streptomyces sp. NPDC002586]|uniref:hypothetical protein n=1 Tax=Streptomyces sp. NPDC002589 TaxID=3154420 RepID=UPI00332650BC